MRKVNPENRTEPLSTDFEQLHPKRRELIRHITENQLVAKDKLSEAQSYSPIRALLTDHKYGIGIPQQCVLTDAPVPFGRERPDIQIWLEGVPVDLRNEQEHLYGIIEVKSGSKVLDGGKSLAKNEITAYRYKRLSHFWLVDAHIVARYDLDGVKGIPDPIVFKWDELSLNHKFTECFSPLFQERRTLRGMLQEFSEIEVPVGDPVGAERRKEFVDSVITVARLLSRTVSELIETRLIPDLAAAQEMVTKMEEDFGPPIYDWSVGTEYLSFLNEPSLDDVDAFHRFNQRYTDLLSNLAPLEYALRAETEHLIMYAKRSGLDGDKASFFKTSKEAKSARESFAQETATLLFSRLLMIRFSEDYDLLPRYISNGGLKTFSQYAKHFKQPFQKLVRDAYENARPLYQHLFERKSLDWIIERQDIKLSDELLHAMWILARWDFKTVRGDILSGVYDKYLDPSQRKRLGEVYTRPEFARYMLEACGWDGSQTIFDPSCGSGTFPVEAFDMIQRRNEEVGLPFSDQDAIKLVSRIYGLDLNEFSATLAKIQLLWHLLSVIKDDPERAIKLAIQSMKIEGGYDSLATWGQPMVKNEDDLFGGNDRRRENAELLATGSRQQRRLKASARRFRDISSNREGYDIVVGNPPYVRIHRIEMADDVKSEYKELIGKQTDLSAFFVYRTLTWWLKPGGRMALFLPMATAEAAYAEKLRRIVEEFKIIEIVDTELLGTTTFHGANIVTIVLIVEKTPYSPDDVVKLTTITADCADEATGTIFMSHARQTIIRRDEIMLERYLPQQLFGDDTNEESTGDGGLESENGDDSDEKLTDTGWLTKIKHLDVSLLDKLASCPRLNELIQIAYEKKIGNLIVDRVSSIPDGELGHLWKAKPVKGYGVKIGGKAPQHVGELPVLKAADSYPDGVDGDPMGYWDGTNRDVDSVRFYGWTKLFEAARSFVIREISLVPVISPHPTNARLTNTAYIIQLAQTFPLNVYALSRIVSWLPLKTARASVMCGSMRAHWFQRNILRIPIPSNITENLKAEISAIGEKIFGFDLEIAAGDKQAEEISNPENGFSKPLKLQRYLIESGVISRPNDVAWPLKDTDWTGVDAIESDEKVLFAMPSALFPDAPAPTATGQPCEFYIREPRLRRWILWLANSLLDAGKIPNAQWLASVAIPNDLDAAINLLDRLESSQALIDLETSIDDLDVIVGAALGLDQSEIKYIQTDMKTDPLFSQLRPAWRHKASRKRKYKAYEGMSRY